MEHSGWRPDDNAMAVFEFPDGWVWRETGVSALEVEDAEQASMAAEAALPLPKGKAKGKAKAARRKPAVGVSDAIMLKRVHSRAYHAAQQAYKAECKAKKKPVIHAVMRDLARVEGRRAANDWRGGRR